MKILKQLERRRAWSEDEQIVLDQVRRVADTVIAPNAMRYDRDEAFPQDSVDAVNSLGLNSIFVPDAYGGTPMSYRLYLAVVQTISEACASTGIIYATNFHGMKPLIDFGTEEQKRRLLPRLAEGALASLAITEAAGGSDATAMTTRFTPDGDDVVVDGSKLFITSGDVADLLLVFGKWSEIDDPKRAVSALIVEKGAPGFDVVRVEEKLGHRASSTAELAFNGCRIPRANLLGRPGEGLSLLLASLNKSRPSIAAHALGIATAAFKDMVAYVNTRTVAKRRIIDFQANQFLIADLAADLAMAELWLDMSPGSSTMARATLGLRPRLASFAPAIWRCE